MDLEAINYGSDKGMMITWDLGRRCNLDCTYCPAHRHNNTSPHADFDLLVATARNVADYCAIYDDHLQFRRTSRLSFTGGEPTVHPRFLELCETLRNTTPLQLNMTSNGVMANKLCRDLTSVLHATTISYHCEAHPKIKENVVANILSMKAVKGFHITVNIMFHARPDYFQECVDLMRILDENDVIYVPRSIGDDDSQTNKESHNYTSEQLQFFKDYWATKNGRAVEPGPKPGAVAAQADCGNARRLGRPCCGARTFRVLPDGAAEEGCDLKAAVWQTATFIEKTQFKDWNCFVNWFFLHIDQESDRVYHHQTCQAGWNHRREPIGTVSGFASIIDDLRRRFSTGAIEPIRCPNRLCGCGLCIAKAKDVRVAASLFDQFAKGVSLRT